MTLPEYSPSAGSQHSNTLLPAVVNPHTISYLCKVKLVEEAIQNTYGDCRIDFGCEFGFVFRWHATHHSMLWHHQTFLLSVQDCNILDIQFLKRV